MVQQKLTEHCKVVVLQTHTLKKKKEGPQKALLPVVPPEDTVSRCQFMNQGKNSYQTPNLSLDLGLPSLQNCEKLIAAICKPSSLWYVL